MIRFFNILIVLLYIINLSSCSKKNSIQQSTKIEQKSLTLQDSIQTSIHKAEKYLESVDYTNFQNNIIYMIADLLAIKFDRKLNLPSLNHLISLNPKYKECHWMMYGNYFDNRTNFPTEVTDSIKNILLSQIEDMDIRSFWTMYCPYFSLNEQILPIINHSIELGEYEATHAALQLESIIINHYCNFDTTVINSMKLNAINSIYHDTQLYFTNKEVANHDLLIEQFAILAYTKQYQLLNKDFIRFVISLQNEDGNWMYRTIDSKEHISILSYWFLLEAYSNLREFRN